MPSPKALSILGVNGTARSLHLILSYVLLTAVEDVGLGYDRMDLLVPA
jgi:hypothetical protein